jgi:ABC-type branched-chain amino acid transport systems, ATPase component
MTSTDDNILNVRNLSAGYGSVTILHDINLKVHAGEIVGLMGRNGMGKSTLLKSIIGLIPPSHGTITLKSTDVTSWPSYKTAKMGLGYVPEGRQVFPNLSVYENLVCVAANHRNNLSPWDHERVMKLFPRLGERRTQLAGTLSGGEQQMLAIGRALTTNPEILLLDEATEGLAPVMRDEVWNVLRNNLREAGQAIILVDQNPEIMLEICDYIVI